MPRGDHIRVRRPLYWHHGIDMGDGTVIHATGEPGRMKLDAEVRRTSMAFFLRGGEASVVESDATANREDVAARAEAALGDRSYNLLFNNCEHFARWCQTGTRVSEQIDTYALAGAAVGLGAQLALRAVASRAGIASVARMLPFVAPVATVVTLAGAGIALASKWNGREP